MDYIHTDRAPSAIGPYSQAVAVDGWLYTSGQIALDPETGEMIDGDFEAQARRVLANLNHVLSAGGCGFSDVDKATSDVGASELPLSRLSSSSTGKLLASTSAMIVPPMSRIFVLTVSPKPCDLSTGKPWS